MTDQPKETLKIATPSKLQLTKTVGTGTVKQNFTHGRSKTVAVEVRKTRTFTQGTSGGLVEVKKTETDAPSSAEDESLKHLTDRERQARLKALKSAEEEAQKAADRKARSGDFDQAGEPLIGEPKVISEGIITAPKRGADDGHIVRPGKSQQTVLASKKFAVTQPAAPRLRSMDEEEDDGRGRGKSRAGKGRAEETQWKGAGKISVSQALSQLEEQRVRSMASVRRQREKAMKKAAGPVAPQEKIIREVTIPEAITVADLANRMAVRAVDVIKVLMKLGMMATSTQSIDPDTAELVVGEFGHKFKRVTEADVENVLMEDNLDTPETLKSRPPVVTVMGHVDHGKTSLLDALRRTDVAAKEAGGITQHIGAYQVEIGNGERVTFLDTPGHEAFTSMRARGAKVTDIVVLVVAADDGIMEQTKEAIAHAKAANVPIIVAVNKIDKPGADPDRVKNELMSYELVAEEYGGNVIVVPVSAKQGTNLDKLVESILVQSEVLELKANPDRMARGVVIESRLDHGRGVVATLLVQKGTLKVGDIVVAGPAYGRVRTLINDKGQAIETATPGMPVEIQGLSTSPEAGDVFSVVDSEKTARDIAEFREKKQRMAHAALSTRTLDQMFGDAAGQGAKNLPVVIKGDVQGSVEAIAGSIIKFNSDEVEVKVLHTGVGAITESDITLAHATGAIIIAFNVRAAPKAKEMATRDKVDIRYYSVIYNVVDDVKAALSGMLSPNKREEFLGYAEIRQVFNISKVGKVGGCMVTEGVVKRGAKVRLLRDNVVIHEGTLKTLKRFKDEVKEVKSGTECGMAFENYEDIREGDVIECFEIVEEARTV